jgi:DNA-binding GntR family transcriptional regulator
MSAQISVGPVGSSRPTVALTRRRVAQLSGNDRMMRLMSEVLDVLGRLALVDLRRYRSVESWRMEHLGIVDALETRDPTATRT